MKCIYNKMDGWIYKAYRNISCENFQDICEDMLR